MNYNEHKLSKEEQFRQWARNEIAQLSQVLTAVCRVAKVDPAKLAEALYEDLPNEVFTRNLSLRVAEVRQRLEDEAKAKEEADKLEKQKAAAAAETN